MSEPNRVPKGVSTAGQFAAGSKAEDAGVMLAARPAEPETLKDALHLGRKNYLSMGVGPDKATGLMVGTASSQLTEQFQSNLKRAIAEGSTELSLAYMESEKAASKVLRSAVANMEDSKALHQDVKDARRGLSSGPLSMFNGFGPNNITSTTKETDRVLGEIETFMDEAAQA